MELLKLRTQRPSSADSDLPFAVYTVGSEMQLPITRLEGHSANQLFFTFAGHGRFRMLGQEKWDILGPGDFLYIPAKLASEYRPLSEEEPWLVGYVSFTTRESGPLIGWGFGQEKFKRTLAEPDRFSPLLKRVWLATGPDSDPWAAAEGLFSLMLELKKQTSAGECADLASPRHSRLQETVVDHAIRFVHDHLGRNIRVSDIAAHVGYSPKQLTRLFRKERGLTPLQYLLESRLRMAHLLLIDHPEMTVRYAASSVGMEPDYFARVYRRLYGCTPTASRPQPFVSRGR